MIEENFRPDPLDAALSGELMRGERVLWKGRAIGRFRPVSLGIWLFALPWTAFALFWTGMAWTATRAAPDTGTWGVIDWVFPLFGLPFILVGLGMIIAPFLAPRRAKNTLFAVTDQRVLRLYKGGKFSVQSVPAERIGSMDRTEDRDGSGWLKIELLGSAPVADGKTRADYFTLGEVENVHMVQTRIREIKERARRAQPALSS